MFRFFSSEIRKIKPDQEIYRHCLQLLNCTASEALFIDDREANVIAARRERDHGPGVSVGEATPKRTEGDRLESAAVGERSANKCTQRAVNEPHS
jgi:beta-phosphoglucomutase-like phosphatase (HAD superfamily)